MTTPRTVSRPSSTSAEHPRDIRARALAFVIQCHVKKRGRLPDKSGPDDAKGSVNDRAKKEYTG